MKNKSGAGDNSKPVSDKVTKDKIDKHLRDKNDTILDQDIKNVKTDFSSDEQDNEPGGSADKGKQKKEMPASWEILDDD